MYHVNVYQTDAMMTVSDCDRTLSWEELFATSGELLEKIGEEKFLYIFQYGKVGFFNPSLEGKKVIRNELKQLDKEFTIGRTSRELNLVVFKSSGDVSFNKIALPYLDSSILRKVLQTINQSVALDGYAKITDQLWAVTTAQNTYLRANGKLNISKKELKMQLGTLWSVTTTIAENRNFFDTIQDIYETTGCNEVDKALRKAFALDESLCRTNEQLALIQENLKLFKAILDHKESSWLEWIIILLIAVEIVDLFVVRFIKWLA